MINDLDQPFWTSSFEIRHSSFSVDIRRPDEFVDQSLSGAVRARVGGHGAGDPDATAKERRSGRSVWRRGHRKYFRRTNHQCPGEVHYVDGRNFLCADAWVVDPLRPQEHRRQCVPARADEKPSRTAEFPGACLGKTFSSVVAWSYADSSFARGFRCA